MYHSIQVKFQFSILLWKFRITYFFSLNRRNGWKEKRSNLSFPWSTSSYGPPPFHSKSFHLKHKKVWVALFRNVSSHSSSTTATPHLWNSHPLKVCHFPTHLFLYVFLNLTKFAPIYDLFDNDAFPFLSRILWITIFLLSQLLLRHDFWFNEDLFCFSWY